MAELLADEDYTLEITALGPWTPGGVDDHTYTENLSSKVKAENKEILIAPLAWVAAGCEFPPNAFSAGGGAIVGLSTKTSIEGATAIRENDTGPCVGVFVPPGGGSVPCSCTFKIDSVGQTKVTGE